jgi:hypothetical protein
MKSKLLIVSLIAVLLFSALNVALTMAQCPTCGGTGRVVCPRCQGSGKITVEEGAVCETCGGSGVLTPTIASKGTTIRISEGKAVVTGMFENKEDVGTHGIATAEVDASTTTYTDVSGSTYFPPHETIDITITIGGISSEDYRYLTLQKYPRGRMYLSEVEDITCPDCDGTGTTSGLVDCPDCGGTGFVPCPDCGGSGVVGGGGGGQEEDVTDSFAVDGAIVGVGVFAAVAIAAVIVLKKRKVTEKALRKLPASELQNWVLKRLAGKPSSLRDSHMGIDGYTIDGQPISIKQSDGVGRNVIENFATAMGRSKAKNGIIVAFSFGDDAFRGKVRAKLNYRLEIKMVTVKELIEGREMISL